MFIPRAVQVIAENAPASAAVWVRTLWDMTLVTLGIVSKKTTSTKAKATAIASI